MRLTFALLVACLVWMTAFGTFELRAQPTEEQRRLAEFGRLSQQITATTDRVSRRGLNTT